MKARAKDKVGTIYSPAPVTEGELFFPKKGFLREEEMEGSDGTREDTEDTTMLLQIEEVMSAIGALPIVTKLSPVGARNSHGHGYRVSLRCFACEEYGSCGKKQEPPVQVSSRNPTELACLQELLKRLQDRHGNCAQALTEKMLLMPPQLLL